VAGFRACTPIYGIADSQRPRSRRRVAAAPAKTGQGTPASSSKRWIHQLQPIASRTRSALVPVMETAALSFPCRAPRRRYIRSFEPEGGAPADLSRGAGLVLRAPRRCGALKTLLQRAGKHITARSFPLTDDAASASRSRCRRRAYACRMDSLSAQSSVEELAARENG